MFLLLLSLLFSAHAQESVTCVVPTAPVKGTNNNTQDTFQFYAGEELKLISSNEKKLIAVVSLGDDKYTLRIKKLARRKKPSCGINFCARLKSKIQYFRSPRDNDMAPIVEDGVYPVMTKTTNNWFRVQINTDYVWLKAAQMKTARVECDASDYADESVGEQIPAMINPDERAYRKKMEHYQWRYGFEL